jgi:GTP-binding protein LepA
MLGSKTEADSIEVGFFRPKMTKAPELNAGEVGYIVTGLRDVSKARVGDTITTVSARANTSALPGYKQVTPIRYYPQFPEVMTGYRVG